MRGKKAFVLGQSVYYYTSYKKKNSKNYIQVT